MRRHAFGTVMSILVSQLPHNIEGGDLSIQLTGYLYVPRTMRLHTIATSANTNIPTAIGYQSAVNPACAYTMMSGLAPAGGCTVRVQSMYISVSARAST